MDVTKPYEFIWFGVMDVTKPYEFIRFGAMDATKPYEFIGFGAMDATKAYECIGVGAMDATTACGRANSSEREGMNSMPAQKTRGGHRKRESAPSSKVKSAPSEGLISAVPAPGVRTEKPLKT